MSKDPSDKSEAKPDFMQMELDDQIRLINEALEGDVYEALQSDGGGMELMDLQVIGDTARLLISYYGACGNCHLAQGGTLAFIQQTLHEKVDPRIEVVVV